MNQTTLQVRSFLSTAVDAASAVGSQLYAESLKHYTRYTAPAPDKKDARLDVVAFSQDGTKLITAGDEQVCLFDFDQNAVESCGTSFATSTSWPLRSVVVPSDGRHLTILERCGNTKLICCVSRCRPNRVVVRSLISPKPIAKINFASQVKAVRVNKRRLVVHVGNGISVFRMSDFEHLHTISCPPSSYVLDLSPTSDPDYLAVPSSSATGEVAVLDLTDFLPVLNFTAHIEPVVVLRFNPDGTQLATASSRGTIIRVHAVPSGDLLFDLNRGLQPVQMRNLSFSPDGGLLCAASDSATVHIFQLKTPPVEESPPAAETNSWFSYVGIQVAQRLPDRLHAGTSFAMARLPFRDLDLALTVQKVDGRDHLLVATAQGQLHRFVFPTELGGDCRLVEECCIRYSSFFEDDTIPVQTTKIQIDVEEAAYEQFGDVDELDRLGDDFDSVLRPPDVIPKNHSEVDDDGFSVVNL